MKKSFCRTLPAVFLSSLMWFASRPAQAGTPPTITSQPVSLTVVAGATNVPFNVGATGTPPLAYQWRLNGTNLTDATNSTYLVSLADATPPTQPPPGYDAVVSNAFGSVTSSVAVLTVYSPVFIIAQPQNQFVLPGSNATFSTIVTGTPPFGFQWYSNGVALGGANGTNYTVTNAPSGAPVSYDVVITNVTGSVTSQVAVLSVRDFTQPAFNLTEHVLTQCTSPAGAVAHFNVTANDKYDPSPTVICTPPSGSLFPIGYSSVTCVATDHFGNSNTGHLQVVVSGQCDAGCLKIYAPPVVNMFLGKSPTVPVNFTVTASNICSGQPCPVVCQPPSGSSFPPGVTPVTCIASPVGEIGSNNWSSVTDTFNVVVTDTNPPYVLTPGNLSICIPNSQTNVAVNYTIQAIDPAGLPVVITSLPASGTLFNLGPTTVNVQATDSLGLSTSTSFQVVVQKSDATDPDWGFENTCGLSGWTVTGFNAPNGSPLNLQPITGDLFTVGGGHFPAVQAQMQAALGGDYWNKLFYPAGHKGHGWLCTADRHVYAAPQLGNINDTIDETLMGSMVSVDFVITNDYISFLIGGTQDSVNEIVELLAQDPSGTIVINGITYKSVTSATGNGRETMRRAWFGSLFSQGLGGKHARVRITDNSRVGHLNVDDFQFSDLPPNQQLVTLRPAALTQGGVQYQAVVASDAINYYDWDSPVWGFADMHTHPMSCLGFGEIFFHGTPDGAFFPPGNPADFTNGLSNCNPYHGGWGLDNTTGDYFRQLVVDASDSGGQNPHNEGYDPNPLVEFRQWPVFDTVTHQQMWYDWIKRSYNGGARVLVALCVNNELLNALSKGAPGAPIDDASVGDLQIQAVKEFVARHSDFMAIAYDPNQLRNIVRNNQMAVVLGSELDDFGNLCQDPNVTTNIPLTAYSKAAVSNAVQHLYDQGLRYMFTVHLVDNKFGGSGSASSDILLAVASKFLNQGAAVQVANATPSDDIQSYLPNIELTPAEQLAAETNGPADLNTLANYAFSQAIGSALHSIFDPLTHQLPEPESGAAGLTGNSGSSGLGIVPILAESALAYYAGNNPNAVLDSILQACGVQDISQFNGANLAPINGNYPIYPSCDGADGSPVASYGVRNVRGLSPLGVYAVQEMMRHGMMLDVDHMSQNAVDDTFNIATNVPGGYPLNSGHNGYREMGLVNCENGRSTNQLPVLQQLGGLLGVGWEDAASGFCTRDFSAVVTNPTYTSSLVANDCAGTCKSWAQEYLYALEKFHGSHVAFGTDADGVIQFPGPRFGPQSAYGLISVDGPCEIYSNNLYLRSSQIQAQANGVLYTHPILLTTPSFTGRAVDYNQDPLDSYVDTLEGSGLAGFQPIFGFQYNAEQADFYAAINMYNYFKANVIGGEPLSNLQNDLVNVQNALSPNYNTYSLGFNVFDNSHQRRIKEFALGLLKGIKTGVSGWNAGDDAGVKWVWPAQTLGIAVYQSEVLNNNSDVNQTLGAYDFWDDNGDMSLSAQLPMLQSVWHDYQQVYGNNVPMIPCKTDAKEWDINFEGVAHYGLIPDFLQDLHNVGLQPQDMSPLFRSAEDFARMWTKSIAGSVAFGPPQIYFIGSDGNGNIIISFTSGNHDVLVQQSSSLQNPSGWVPATISASESNPVTTSIVVTPSSCASCAVYFRLVSSP